MNSLIFCDNLKFLHFCFQSSTSSALTYLFHLNLILFAPSLVAFYLGIRTGKWLMANQGKSHKDLFQEIQAWKEVGSMWHPSPLCPGQLQLSMTSSLNSLAYLDAPVAYSQGCRAVLFRKWGRRWTKDWERSSVNNVMASRWLCTWADLEESYEPWSLDQAGNEGMSFSSILFISKTSSFHPLFFLQVNSPARCSPQSRKGENQHFNTPPAFQFPDEINWYVTVFSSVTVWSSLH